MLDTGVARVLAVYVSACFIIYGVWGILVGFSSVFVGRWKQKIAKEKPI